MDKIVPVPEPHSLNRAGTAYKFIRLNEKAILNLAFKTPSPSITNLSPPQSITDQLPSIPSGDTTPATARQSTGPSNVNRGDMTARKVAPEPPSFRSDLSITFVPCGYLRCTQCYEFPPGNPSIGWPRPKGFISQMTASDVDVYDMSSDESDCFEDSDYDDSTAEEHKDTDGSEMSDPAGDGTPCIGNVVQGNLIGAGRDGGDHEVDGMDVDPDAEECGSDSDYALSDASTACSSGDEYVPPQAATNRKARKTVAARSKRRSGHCR